MMQMELQAVKILIGLLQYGPGYLENITWPQVRLKVSLAHSSPRFIGELIVYAGILRRPSTFSNNISSEAEKLILFTFHIQHL